MEIKEIYEKLVHNKYKVFFTEKGGLSVTEASHRANLIKEKSLSIDALFKTTSGYHSVLDLEGKQIQIDNFVKIDLLDNAEKEGDVYGYTAWLREAIKAKQDLLAAYSGYVSNTLLLIDDETPLEFKESAPQCKQLNLVLINENDVIGTFTIAERAEYYHVEAQATHIGKKIHNGVISRIRNEVHAGKVTSFKALPKDGGEHTYIINHHALYTAEEIDEIFFTLQEKHRVLEEKLNYYKARIKNEVTTRNAEIQKAYTLALKAESQAHKVLLEAWNQKWQDYLDAVSQRDSALEERRLKLISYISALKIVIPNSFQELNDNLRETKAK